MSDRKPNRYLVADVGGTNARFALAESIHGDNSNRFQFIDSRSFAVAQFQNFEDVIAEYLDSQPAGQKEICGASLAVASAVGVEEICFTNSPWKFSRASLVDRFKFPQLMIINDFEALALQIAHSPSDFIQKFRNGEHHPYAARVVVGPGTGLGVAGLIRSSAADQSRWHAIPGEGGHIAFAPGNDLEMELLGYLQRKYGRVSIERVASGPGLRNIYRFLCEKFGSQPLEDSPDAISKRALSNSEAIASDAVRIFLEIVGSFAGDAAMMFGARGGVFLGGGILPRLMPAIAKSDFFLRFNGKGRHTHWMEKIPISLIVSDKAALLGAAVALRLAH